MPPSMTFADRYGVKVKESFIHLTIEFIKQRKNDVDDAGEPLDGSE